MRRISKNYCSVLPLVLKGKWYDMIASGEKKEEYREYKEFWIKRIGKWQDTRYDHPVGEPMKMDVIAFSRGYKKADMYFVCDKILIRKGKPVHPDWGEPNIRHFVIGLGERIDLRD